MSTLSMTNIYPIYTMSLIIEDEFGQIYIFPELRTNIDFPIRRIELPPNSKIILSNVRIGQNGLTDEIRNHSSDILSLTHSEIIDRIRLSSIRSFELKLNVKPQSITEDMFDEDDFDYERMYVIIGIVTITCIVYGVFLRYS
jgi:hypothetical protein